MIKTLKQYYYKASDNVTDKVTSSIDVLKRYLEKAQGIILSLSFRFAIVVIVIIAAMWSGKYVWGHLTDQKMFMVSPITFSFEAPDWATDELVNEIKNIPGAKGKYNMFEKDLTRKIAELYEKSPFVAKVYYVERELPDRINLKIELRKPLAIVKRKGKEFLVDKDCVRLPEKLYNYPFKEEDAIYIINRRRLRVVEYGETWDNVAVNEGVNLLNYLKYNKIDKLLNIGIIDVSNVKKNARNGKSDISLWTKNGTLVKWGCAPSPEKPNELSNYEKLQNLLSVVNEEGTSLAKMEYVDVRWKMPVGRRIASQ